MEDESEYTRICMKLFEDDTLDLGLDRDRIRAFVRRFLATPVVKRNQWYGDVLFELLESRSQGDILNELYEWKMGGGSGWNGLSTEDQILQVIMEHEWKFDSDRDPLQKGIVDFLQGLD